MKILLTSCAAFGALQFPAVGAVRFAFEELAVWGSDIRSALGGPPAPPPGGPVLSTPSGAFTDFGPTVAWGHYLELTALFCLLLLILWLGVKFLRAKAQRGPAGPVPPMYVESRLALAPKKWIVVARFLDKRLVLGLTDQQISLLAQFDVPPEEPVGQKNAAPALHLENFEELLLKTK